MDNWGNRVKAGGLDNAIVSVSFPGNDTCAEIMEVNVFVFRKQYLKIEGHNVCDLFSRIQERDNYPDR